MTDMICLTEAATYLGVSLLTLRRKIRENSLEVYHDKVDTRYKFVRKAELDRIRQVWKAGNSINLTEEVLTVEGVEV